MSLEVGEGKPCRPNQAATLLLRIAIALCCVTVSSVDVFVKDDVSESYLEAIDRLQRIRFAVICSFLLC